MQNSKVWYIFLLLNYVFYCLPNFTGPWIQLKMFKAFFLGFVEKFLLGLGLSQISVLFKCLNSVSWPSPFKRSVSLPVIILAGRYWRISRSSKLFCELQVNWHQVFTRFLVSWFSKAKSRDCLASLMNKSLGGFLSKKVLYSSTFIVNEISFRVFRLKRKHFYWSKQKQSLTEV